MKKKHIQELQKIAGDQALFDEPLSKHTTFGIGGNAACFVYSERDTLQKILQFSDSEDIPIFFIGSGSNLLVSDSGFNGIVISLAKTLKKLEFSKTLNITCESGVMLGHFVKEALKHGVANIEGLVGVPGTVGGALIMNAGAYNHEISTLLKTATVFTRSGEIKTYKKKDILFSYRYSTFPKDEILIEAKFKGRKGKKSKIIAGKLEASQKRKASQPLKYRSAGSIFKNPSMDLAAGYLIDQAGLKGRKSGGAEISEKHANFIINKGNAKAIDVIRLIRSARNKVIKKFNVELQLEIKLLGFAEKLMNEFSGLIHEQ